MVLASDLGLAGPPEVGGLFFQATLGFNGYFRQGTWVPLQVELANEGFPFTATIEVVTYYSPTGFAPTDIRIVHKRTVNMPTTARKRIYMNIPIIDAARPIEVRLVHTDGTVLSSTRIPLRDMVVNADIILVLDTSGERWSWLQEAAPTLPGYTRQARVYVIHARSEADLPEDWVSYESVRTVIITDNFPVNSLSNKQVTALLQWVEAGGHLVMSGGPSLAALGALELTAALPVKPAAYTQILSLHSLGPWFNPLPHTVSTVCWVAEPGSGNIELTQDNIPLLAHRALGNGRLSYIAFDLATATWRDWSAFDQFSRQLVFPPRVVHKNTTQILESSLLPMLLSFGIAYPRHIYIALFLICYGILLLLMLYIARKRRRAWLALLGIAIIGNLTAAVVIGPMARRSLRTYAEIKVSVIPPQAGKAHSFAVGQIMDMHGGYWPIQRASAAYFNPVFTHESVSSNLLLVDQRENEVVIGPTLARQTQALASQELVELPIRVSMLPYKLDWQLTLHNQTQWPLRNAFYVDQQRYIYIGDVAANNSTTISFPADHFVVANDQLSPEWLAASIGAISRKKDPHLGERQIQALITIATYALTADTASYLPWGQPLIIAILKSPVRPPLTAKYTGVGYHFVVIPLSTLLK